MSSPMVFLEELTARRASLVDQLELMENHQADPQRHPSFGTHTNYVSTTDESIARVQEQIAEIDGLIAKMQAGNA